MPIHRIRSSRQDEIMKPSLHAFAHVPRAIALGLVLVAAMHSDKTLAAPPTPTPVTSWELTGEFSLNNNTNANGQAWSYGYQVFGIGGWVFNPLTAGGLVAGLQGWRNGASASPGIYQNQAVAPFLFGSIHWPNRHVLMVPGPSCERATVRFTPPLAGLYRISGQFYGMDNAGYWPAKVAINQRSTTSTASSVIHQGLITPGGNLQSSFTSKLVALAATDRVDFEVGCGNGVQPFPNLWTGVHAVIERMTCPPGPPCD
jgi:hypothetical protein